MIKYGEWQILPGSWSAQLIFGRSGNTANLDLKTILYLLTTCEIIMVKMMEIMVQSNIFIISPFWKYISRESKTLNTQNSTSDASRAQLSESVKKMKIEEDLRKL